MATPWTALQFSKHGFDPRLGGYDEANTFQLPCGVTEARLIQFMSKLPKTAEDKLKVLLKTGHCLIEQHVTELLLSVTETKRKDRRFKVQYDGVNKGAWLGNQPVGAKFTTRNQALRAVSIFPKKLPGITRKAYLDVSS